MYEDLPAVQNERHRWAVSYDDLMTASPVRPVILRDGADVDDPLRVVLGFLTAPGRFDASDPARPAWFGEPDLRRVSLVPYPVDRARCQS
jgi:hypothetical protein